MKDQRTMKRPEQHQIDEMAQRRFRDKLPTSWVMNEHFIDYGKDYHLETADQSSQLTGVTCYVQLKGQRSVKHDKDGKHIKFSLESKYARYYVEKVQDLPVFLVVVDTSTGEAWWLFLQEYLVGQTNWKRQKTSTIYLPKKNGFEEVSGFEKAIKRAQGWLRARHPASIPDAVSAYKSKLEALDPRFRASVRYHDGATHTWIEPRNEPVTVTLKMKGEPDSLTQKMEDLIQRGKKVCLEEGEYELEGSSLFTEHGPGPIEIQWASSFQGTATIALLDDAMNEVAYLSEISGVLAGGVSELTFKTIQSSLPVIIESPALHSAGGKLQFSFPISVWDESPILHLPFFDKVYEFFRAMDHAKYLRASFHLDGNLLAEGKPSDFEMSQAKVLSQLVSSLKKARELFRKVGMNPTWHLNRFDEDFVDTVELAYALVFGDGIRRPLPNHSIKMTIPRKTLNEGVLALAHGPVLLRLSSELIAVILDQEIPLGIVSDDFSDVIIRRSDIGASGGDVEVEVVTTESSIRSRYVLKEHHGELKEVMGNI